MINNLRVLLLLLTLTFVYLPEKVFGQAQDQKADGDLPPTFTSNPLEASATCGEFLPNQVPGISEMMPVCGGRAGFKLSKNSAFEAQALGGAAYAQRYLIGSGTIRSDLGLDDFIISMYFGGDVHYVTAPVLNATTGAVVSEQTNMYFGGHLGGAVWFPAGDNLYFRTDLQFFLNPGTALYVGFGFVLKFGGGGGGGGAGGGGGGSPP